MPLDHFEPEKPTLSLLQKFCILSYFYGSCYLVYYGMRIYTFETSEEYLLQLIEIDTDTNWLTIFAAIKIFFILLRYIWVAMMMNKSIAGLILYTIFAVPESFFDAVFMTNNTADFALDFSLPFSFIYFIISILIYNSYLNKSLVKSNQ